MIAFIALDLDFREFLLCLVVSVGTLGGWFLFDAILHRLFAAVDQ